MLSAVFFLIVSLCMVLFPLCRMATSLLLSMGYAFNGCYLLAFTMAFLCAIIWVPPSPFLSPSSSSSSPFLPPPPALLLQHHVLAQGPPFSTTDHPYTCASYKTPSS